jgi:hypothetical protein
VVKTASIEKKLPEENVLKFGLNFREKFFTLEYDNE